MARIKVMSIPGGKTVAVARDGDYVRITLSNLIGSCITAEVPLVDWSFLIAPERAKRPRIEEVS